MEFRQEDDTLSGEQLSNDQVSIWAVRRKLFAAYFVTFSLLFFLISGIAAWLAYAPIKNIRDASELAMTAMGMASGRILWLAAFSIISVEVGNMIVEYLIVDRYKRGLSKGRKETNQKWQAWYERQQAAQREGLPFDEPPPGMEDKGE